MGNFRIKQERLTRFRTTLNKYAQNCEKLRDYDFQPTILHGLHNLIDKFNNFEKKLKSMAFIDIQHLTDLVFVLDSKKFMEIYDEYTKMEFRISTFPDDIMEHSPSGKEGVSLFDKFGCCLSHHIARILDENC